MDVYIDHYFVLGLPSGEKGSKVSYNDITKAYKSKALELHPDKNPNDPNAVINFQNLQASYKILKDENTRKKFDDSLIRRDERKRSTSDVGERKRARGAAFEKQQRMNAAFIKRERKRAEERERKRAFSAFEERERKRVASVEALIDDIRRKSEKGDYDRFRLKRRGENKENVVRVFWTKGGLDYSEKRLRKVFEKFGEVEDVIMSFVNRGSAIIVMATKDAAVAAARTGSGDLLVRPLQQVV